MHAQGNWVSFWTILRKEVIRFFRVWTQTIFPPVITMSLYFVIFGQFIGSQIAPIEGFSYMQFIVPGLVMLSVIMNSFMNTVSSFYFSKFQRTLEEIMVSPTPYPVVIAGFVAGGVIRGMLTGALVLVVALFFTDIAPHNVLVILVFALLAAILFSLVGLMNAVFANNFDGISIIPNFVLTPLTYLGGIFYSTAMLPPFWRTVSEFNPILYMVNGFRYGFLGISDVNVWVSFGVLVSFVLLFFVINWWLFKTGRGLRS